VPVPYFLLFLCFRKVTQEIFLELDETKAERPKIHRSFQRTEEEMEWGHEGPTQQGGVAWPLAAPLCVRAPQPTPDVAPSPIKTPWQEKPKCPIRIPARYRVPPPSSTWDWEGPEALPGTLLERGITTGGLHHRHACLQRDECVVYLGLWVHSSS
jgi:hypothetical protein